MVVKDGLRLNQKQNNANAVAGHIQLKPYITREPARRERKQIGIVGTGDGSNIKVVKTKLVSVFATRFAPDLEADTLSNYLSKKLGRSVKCRKIVSSRNRFSSFHASAECNEVKDMYDPQLWPAGVYVRRYYEARLPRLTSVDGGHGTDHWTQDNGQVSTAQSL